MTTTGAVVDHGAMAEYTDREKEQVRRAVLSALAYVSQADPGFFAAFSESAAGAKALSEAPEPVRELLSGGLIMPERETKEQFDATVGSDLKAAVDLVAAKDPAEADALKGVVNAGIQQVAEASKGVSPAEQEAIDTIRAALA